ncbi:MAG: HEAT repeat domain-containing protein, partial [Chlamydiales bacterium]
LGEIPQALTTYLTHAKATEGQDFDLLQQVGRSLLEQGAGDSDPEIQLMSLFGAGVALSPQLLPVLEKGIRSKEIKSQLVALNFLGHYDDDVADQLLMEALSSPFLLPRLEACFQLAQKKNPIVVDHVAALYYKVPDMVHTLFPQIIVHIDTESANQIMQQYLCDQDFQVRVEALLHIAKQKRDDFLPQIHKLASQTHFALQEASALCFAEMQDRSAIPLLQYLTQSKQEDLSLVALFSLHLLGESSAEEQILARAEGLNLFAITALGKVETKKSRELLYTLLDNRDRDVQLNAALSLLAQRDPKCLPFLETMIIKGTKDIGFYRKTTPAGAIGAWKAVSSATQKEKNLIGLAQASAGLKGVILTSALELPEENFLQLARLIFEKQETILIPPLIDLLVNHRSANSIALLKEMQQKTGAPYIRNYCNLALFQLGEKGPYEQNLVDWIKKEQDKMLISFKEERSKERESQFTLTAEETSQFLINAFETLCSAQSLTGIETLIQAIAYGNPKNRYALAGLLIRTTE